MIGNAINKTFKVSEQKEQFETSTEIYLVKWNININILTNVYDSFVCFAQSEDEARLLNPASNNEYDKFITEKNQTDLWIPFEDIDKLQIKRLGWATKTETQIIQKHFLTWHD